jgi:hypothetical protein
MCKSSSATEETHSGSYRVDSVVLRIMTQEDDCICRVMIDNQNDTLSVGIRKFDGLTASAPYRSIYFTFKFKLLMIHWTDEALFLIDFIFIFGVLTSLSAIFQQYHGDQF